MCLRWLTQALADLREIHSYIARDNPEAARRVVGEIRREVEILATQPESGRPGRLSGSREFVIRKYYSGAVAADAGGQPTDNVVCRDAHRGDCIQFGPFAFAVIIRNVAKSFLS